MFIHRLGRIHTLLSLRGLRRTTVARSTSSPKALVSKYYWPIKGTKVFGEIVDSRTGVRKIQNNSG